jgi:hypothetical protein
MISMNKWLIAGLLVLGAVTASVAYVTFRCPCERLPGFVVWGEEQSQPVDDWTFANEARLCQLQVSNGVLPQSLNLNCMADEGELFVSCASCDGKRWSITALAHPDGKILIDGKVYPVRLQRLTDPAQLDRAWAAREDKLTQFGREARPARADHWWSFQLTSR